jgi:hypothetical protein
LYESAIQNTFVDAFNQLYSVREQLMEDYAFVISILTDTAALYDEVENLKSECDITVDW